MPLCEIALEVPGLRGVGVVGAGAAEEGEGCGGAGGGGCVVWGGGEGGQLVGSSGEARKEGWGKGGGQEGHTIILNPHRSRKPHVRNLIIPPGKLPRARTIIQHRIMIVLRVIKIVAQIVLEGDGGGRRAAVGGVAVFVVDSLGAVFVDVGVVPEGEGGVAGDEVGGFGGFGARGGGAGVVEFAGAAVEGEDLGVG